MAVFITASGISASRLFAKIKAEIARENSSIATWAYNVLTGFTHKTSSGDWNKGAYLRVVSSDNPQLLVLYYNIEEGKKSQIIPKTFGVLNGRFAEMIVNHFKGDYSNIEIKDLRS